VVNRTLIFLALVLGSLLVSTVPAGAYASGQHGSHAAVHPSATSPLTRHAHPGGNGVIAAPETHRAPDGADEHPAVHTSGPLISAFLDLAARAPPGSA
jgi:hypothetical protein